MTQRSSTQSDGSPTPSLISIRHGKQKLTVRVLDMTLTSVQKKMGCETVLVLQAALANYVMCAQCSEIVSAMLSSYARSSVYGQEHQVALDVRCSR